MFVPYAGMKRCSDAINRGLEGAWYNIGYFIGNQTASEGESRLRYQRRLQAWSQQVGGGIMQPHV